MSKRITQTTYYYSLHNLASDWARATGEDSDDILDRLIGWAVEGSLPGLTVFPSEERVSPDDLLDAWLAFRGHKKHPGHAIWTLDDAEKLIQNAQATSMGVESFCQKHRVNPPEGVYPISLDWVKGRATAPPLPPSEVYGVPSIMPEAQQEDRKGEAEPKMGFSEPAVERDYIERVKTWPPGTPHPNRDDDVDWARGKFGIGVPVKFIHGLRSLHVPAEWKMPGPRKK